MLRKLTIFCVAAVLALPDDAQFGKILEGLGNRGPSDSNTASGLKEALQIGTDDARKILTGGNTSAAEYFKRYRHRNA